VISVHLSQVQAGMRWPHHSWREMHQSRMLIIQWKNVFDQLSGTNLVFPCSTASIAGLASGCILTNHCTELSLAGSLAACVRKTLMRRQLPKLLLSLVLTALLFMPGSSSTSLSIAEASDAFARFPNEVKLRKLHLVRPDLIPYPLFFEVYA